MTTEDLRLPLDGQGELALAARLESLHQLLYTRGGIKPVNAAVEELSKLLLLRIAAHRFPDLAVSGSSRLVDVLIPENVRQNADTSEVKNAFREVVAHPNLRAMLPDGTNQPVWPLDEPLRVTRVDVLAEALDVLALVELDTVSCTGVDALGTAFDTFLRGRYDHAGGLGTYLTPATVAKAMTQIGFELLARDPEGLVGDPCCGTGRFLASVVAERLRQDPDRSIESAMSGLVGADQSAASVAMARVNMLAYGAHHPRLFTVDDSITDGAIDQLVGQFDLILTNPPFGDSKYDHGAGIARSATWLPGVADRRRIDPALAFVSRCIDLLAPDGVAGIILPDGVLDGPVLREALLGSSQDHFAVEGIVSLPTVTFAPAGTMAKTSVLFLRRGKPARDAVFLARVGHVGYVKHARGIIADPDGDDLPEVTRQVAAMLKKGAASPLESDQISQMERAALTSLDASTYDLDAIDARAELVGAGGAEFSTLLTSVRKSGNGRRSLSNVPFVSVLHVDDLGAIDWAQALHYSPTTPGRAAEAGSVIVSLLNPRKFRAAVIPERFPVVQCSSEFAVFRPKIDPYAALALLQHPLVRAQIAPMGRGTSSSRRRVSDEDVLGLIAPAWTPEWEISTGAEAAKLYDQLAQARLGLHSLFAALG